MSGGKDNVENNVQNPEPEKKQGTREGIPEKYRDIPEGGEGKTASDLPDGQRDGSLKS